MSFVRNSRSGRRGFPFTAILGQEAMKLALLLNAVNPAVGGVVVRGQKGTAKSTTARGLGTLLPAAPGGGVAPFVDFPLGATEDMVVGSIDFESAVRQGKVRFQPGLLARAHQGILYVDEVNLLDDHLVDAILDAAQSGVTLVEREGLSLSHPSRFILVGTMNPEEGELRPQLLDRFGLAVSIGGESDPSIRVELLRRRESFDADPDGFLDRHRAAEEALAQRILAARERLGDVRVPAHLLSFIAEICQRNHVAGHRADIVMERAARAHAAWNDRIDVTGDDILAVAPMVLLHRMRSAAPDLPPPPPPPPPPSSAGEDADKTGERQPDHGNDAGAEPDRQPAGESPRTDDAPSGEADGKDGRKADEAAPPEPGPPPPEGDQDRDGEVQEIGAPFRVRRFDPEAMDQRARIGSGRRTRSRSAGKQGRYVKSTPRRLRDDLALDATLRAAAPYQKARRAADDRDLAVLIAEPDIREKIRERRIGNFLLFVVDGSGSMGARRRMVETKAAIMSLLLDAYQKRDKVAMVLFRGREAEVVLPPTGSVDRAAHLLAELPVGGRTPLVMGLAEAARVLRQVLRKDPGMLPLVIVMTDGRANAGFGTRPPHEEALVAASALGQRFPNARFVVVDTETPGVVRLELARKLAAALGAAYFRTEDLSADDLVSLAKEHQAW